ncbi:MAG: NAD-dependent epimerase/dehydratase family protein [Pseudolabrys sp.]|nr:NAD-dependent epimerase/dehydratase family protein [Pseudolabrys sp.]
MGLGYSAAAYIGGFGERIGRVSGTVRSEAKRQALAARGIDAFVFDGQPHPGVTEAIRAADAILVSAPPAELAATTAAMLAPGQTPAVVYLSSLSVYGDHGGAEIDEDAALKATSVRGRERIAAEEAWRQFGRASGCPVAILRLAGIYGPGRNALITVAKGEARRIVKPGQVFNRIHVADIAQAIAAAFERRADGVFNGADDEPAPPQDVIAYAANLLGVPPPPEMPFEEAKRTMSPMARSFYAESKRALNRRLKTGLGVTLRYPTYREGLDALFAARDHESSGEPSA